MADRGGKFTGAGNKPVPMKLFATWEVEKSSPNCIPRLCNLTLTRLVVARPLENDLNSVILAVKMQSTKGVLRSNEISLPPSGLLDTELELTFSLQYPHFLKRDGNKLQVMLQRRKRYKNRTILGYKTLAIGVVNMAQVLQRSVDRELNLYSDPKERNNKVASVTVLALSSQPVDHEENGRLKLRGHEADRSPDVDLTDEEDGGDDPEDWSNEDLSDSEPNEDRDSHPRSRKSSRIPGRQGMSQRNIKQKFISLLRRFKISEEDGDIPEVRNAHPQEIEDLFDELEDLSDSGPEMDTISVLSTPKPKLRPFFTGRGSALDILDVPRDSGRLSDDSSKRNDSDSHLDYLTDPEHSDSQSQTQSLAQSQSHSLSQTPGQHTPPQEDKWERSEKPEKVSCTPPGPCIVLQTSLPQPPSPAAGSASWTNPFVRDRAASMREKKSSKREKLERRNSAGNVDAAVSEPRKVLLDQLSSVLSSDEALPESLILINTNEWQGQLLAQMLPEHQYRVIHTCSSADVKATMSYIVNKVQKFCNSNSRAPKPIKIVVAGGDGYLNVVLRPYVEQFAHKSHDWQGYLRFLYIPICTSSLAKYMASVDNMYNSLFYDSLWKETFEKAESPRPAESAEVCNRISCYISGACHVVQLPIGEAMITYKEKMSEEESSQIFVPFINEVRVGPIEIGTGTSTSVDLDENPSPVTPCSQGVPLSSSPPHQQGILAEKAKENHTPPSSPNVNHPVLIPSSGLISPLLATSPPECLDLQLDYWSVDSKVELGPREKLQKKDSKASLKTTFKCVRVYRLPQTPAADLASSALAMVVITKEKKQKIMRLGKKSKGDESKSQMVDGISRLICTSKSQSNPLTVTIDGADWHGVKFFQLSAQWQTHVKHLPLGLFSGLDSPL